MEVTRTDTDGLPDGWTAATLGELANIQRGASPRPISSPVWFSDRSRVGWIRISDVSRSDGRRLTHTQQYVSDRGIRNSRFVPAGTLVMSICATVGVPVITALDACIHDGFVGFTDLKGVDQNFLFYTLQELEPTFVSLGQSGTQVNLNSGIVRGQPIGLPPLDEQRAIAAALTEADNLVSTLDALIEKKRAVKEAVMQRLLTGRQRLPGFDGEWALGRLGALATLGGGMSASRADLSISGHRYLHYGDIHVTDRTHAHVHEHYDERPRLNIPLARAKRSSLLTDGDVVFVDASEDEEGASRHVVIVNPTGTPFISGLHTIVARGLTAHFDTTYMRYAFQAPAVKAQFRFYAAGTKVMGVSKSNMSKIEVPIPERAEQEAIGAILLSMDTEIEAFVARRDKARLVKRGMAQDLLTGRIRLVS